MKKKLKMSNTDTTPIMQAPEPGPSSSTQEKPDLEVLTTVFYYCFTIIVMPVMTFFVTKHVFFGGLFGVDSVTSNVYSAIASIIVVHISLALFIKRAYSEADRVKPQKQD
uniref:Vacuolar ATPase assembly integral membrane protein VMA21 homolog n=1 Tax=Cacopsylla melanoneura TaxID=428564 RepID=A0A8D8TZI9_9HEMI